MIRCMPIRLSRRFASRSPARPIVRSVPRSRASILLALFSRRPRCGRSGARSAPAPRRLSPARRPAGRPSPPADPMNAVGAASGCRPPTNRSAKLSNTGISANRIVISRSGDSTKPSGAISRAAVPVAIGHRRAEIQRVAVGRAAGCCSRSRRCRPSAAPAARWRARPPSAPARSGRADRARPPRPPSVKCMRFGIDLVRADSPVFA